MHRGFVFPSLNYLSRSAVRLLRQMMSHFRETLMMIKSLAVASAGLALVAAPVAASAAPANHASGLSVSKSVRIGSSATRKSNLAGSGFIIVILAAVAVAGGVYLAVDGDDDSDSN
jgi:hypothetical protein